MGGVPPFPLLIIIIILIVTPRPRFGRWGWRGIVLVLGFQPGVLRIFPLLILILILLDLGLLPLPNANPAFRWYDQEAHRYHTPIQGCLRLFKPKSRGGRGRNRYRLNWRGWSVILPPSDTPEILAVGGLATHRRPFEKCHE